LYQAFDVIGDIHGQYDKLVELLEKMEYQQSVGVWRHAKRTAIFVGDLIDRGPGQVKTVELVRAMVAAGSARCILGNHEFNAIAWATEDPVESGKFLRPHTDKNREQHAAFLAEVKPKTKHDEMIAWFKTLPLWLDLGGLRIVHACWHEESMDVLRPWLNADHTLTNEALRRGSQRNDPVFDAIEIVCKGPEVRLPDGLTFKDKEGNARNEVRIAWWHEDRSTFREAAHIHRQYKHLLPDGPLPGPWRTFAYVGPPVIFGHYWFTGTPAVNDKHFCCVDYSVANGGPLVAYRWDGERELSTLKLVSV